MSKKGVKEYHRIRVAHKQHHCGWCPKPIEIGTEYWQDSITTRYHIECFEKKKTTRNSKHFSPTEKLAYWFVTEFLGEKFSWNLHKRYLAEAKFYVNPKADPLTGEQQQSFTAQTIMDCLEAMRAGYFGVPKLDIRTIHAVTWKNRTGRTFLEDWLIIPALPPTYRTMGLQDWISRYGDRAVEQEVINGGQLEMLKAIALGKV